MDLTQPGQYCESIGPRELALYRIFGMIIFYTLSYLFYPKRIIRSFRNIFFTKRTATVFEQRIVEMINTFQQIRKTKNTLQETRPTLQSN
jgi:hypothetical protein